MDFLLWPLALIMRWLGIRGLRPEAEMRIGHMLDEAFLAMAWIVDGSLRARIVIAPFNSPDTCNHDVARRLNPTYFFVPRNRFINRLILRRLARHPLLRLDTLSPILSMPCPMFSLDPTTYPQLLVSDDTDRLTLNALLGRHGVTRDYVCVHVRTEGYSTIDDGVQSHRNAAVTDLDGAIDYLIAAGYHVVRIGGPFGDESRPRDGFWDYAHSVECGPLNDYLLISNCSLFVGNTSGIYALAALHGIPVLGVNMAPINAYGVFGTRTMSIPKLYFSEQEGRLLTFTEAAWGPFGNSLAAVGFETAGVRLVANSSDEIRRAVADFVRFSEDSTWHLDDSQAERQRSFRNAIPPSGYGATSRTVIAPSFLEVHCHLLGTEDD